MKKFILLIMTLIPFALLAQSYNTVLIADSLTKNANVVKRYDEIRVEIKDINKAKVYEKHVYTILNEAGDDYADYVTRYDKFNEINYINGTLFDSNGKELKNVKKKDIEDLSGNSDASLIDDARYKRHNFYYKNYPYTVAYEEEDNKNTIYDLPDWNPQGQNISSVEYSKYSITTPKNIPIRYKEFNFAGQPDVKEENGTVTYTWQIRNLTAKTGEQLQPAWHKILSSVIIAPTDFEMQGYKGNMSTWKDLGIFGYSLLQGRDALPDIIKQKVHELCSNVSDDKEKVKILYQFLQQNTRYISIQLGIGGLQPFDANYVCTKRYGDCKALSNYMVALLKEAGIKAYSAWVRGSWKGQDFITDFPSDQFNHVIACVPVLKDTIWLECTSQTDPPGYNGGFTGNRYALLLDETGGQLVPTSKYTSDDNKQTRNISSTIDETGKLTALINTNYRCMQQDDLHGMINQLSKDKVLEQLKKIIDLPDYDVTDFSYKENKSEKPSIDEQLHIIANNYASVSGKRLFIMPNILSKYTIKLKQEEHRKYNIELNYAFTDIDTINIKIPAAYNIESMPKDVSISNQFGDYEIHFTVNTDNINCIRLYKRSQGIFPPTDYEALVKFYDAIYKADRSRIVFVKKEG